VERVFLRTGSEPGPQESHEAAPNTGEEKLTSRKERAIAGEWIIAPIYSSRLTLVLFLPVTWVPAHSTRVQIDLAALAVRTAKHC